MHQMKTVVCSEADDGTPKSRKPKFDTRRGDVGKWRSNSIMLAQWNEMILRIIVLGLYVGMAFGILVSRPVFFPK
jgi:hypothetical protein